MIRAEDHRYIPISITFISNSPPKKVNIGKLQYQIFLGSYVCHNDENRMFMSFLILNIVKISDYEHELELT